MRIDRRRITRSVAKLARTRRSLRRSAAGPAREETIMTGRVEGKVALITGAARGQGRSHAITLAREGADIIAVDIAAQIASAPYPMATPEDLAQTVKEVEATGRRIVATQADVRDYDALKEALDDGVAQLGRLDIVSANAGITSYGRAEDLAEQTWRDMIDVDLTGVWHAAKAAIPHLRAGGRGGAVILTPPPNRVENPPKPAPPTGRHHSGCRAVGH